MAARQGLLDEGLRQARCSESLRSLGVTSLELDGDELSFVVHGQAFRSFLPDEYPHGVALIFGPGDWEGQHEGTIEELARHAVTACPSRTLVADEDEYEVPDGSGDDAEEPDLASELLLLQRVEAEHKAQRAEEAEALVSLCAAGLSNAEAKEAIDRARLRGDRLGPLWCEQVVTDRRATAASMRLQWEQRVDRHRAHVLELVRKETVPKRALRLCYAATALSPFIPARCTHEMLLEACMLLREQEAERQAGGGQRRQESGTGAGGSRDAYAAPELEREPPGG
eukprot:gnl/TRDRNA2_/TRDRNA2_199460_c0_seq1.p1 gnl/TRDRNA2_/TRDRNA2_199460_c0~~gnl/TRDRNA2_/TRDRNA2_199460_c0_seq1.p1  ORF type:complete len:301 (+),score=56.25 gnl/TRDRNA2_/TRDRNA2_199460_c0_seq1:57-905(+)